MGLWFVTNMQMPGVMKDAILQQLVSSVETQAEIVRSYVDKAESYLAGYVQAPEVENETSGKIRNCSMVKDVAEAKGHTITRFDAAMEKD